jgi:tetratricopeptide (TPR) repeat protein
MLQGKFDDAVRVLHQGQSPMDGTPANNAGLLNERAAVLARLGLFQEAIVCLKRAIEADPADRSANFNLFPLLVHTGDVEAYREHCRKVRRQFSDTTEPVLAERMAKACCLLPPSVEDFEVIRQWAETGVNVDPPPPWSMLARGIAEYRQGRFEAAVEWAPKGYPCRGD